MSVKIISDGTVPGTDVLVDGVRLRGVQRIEFIVEASGAIAGAWIKVLRPELEVDLPDGVVDIQRESRATAVPAYAPLDDGMEVSPDSPPLRCLLGMHKLPANGVGRCLRPGCEHVVAHRRLRAGWIRHTSPPEGSRPLPPPPPEPPR